ncbi:Prefoldin subunit 5 [Choanephora cucurbitarum]|uniref:Prefoldin subunit 5 n=1 Tax=Choanephora cucurbitarum TaxID=101091 RepID=A0A1C7N9W1_9FUNG|nr:Prefoldin subunit 5 [Choanephora cucurbitarum]
MSQQQVNIADLDLASLQQVKSQLEEELSHLTQSYTKLKGVQARFTDCADSVNALKTERADELLFLNLDVYLYVPGKISDVNKVIVDVGTGYYIEKLTRVFLSQSVGDASKFYNDKVDYVKKNLGTLEKTITDKQSTLRAIVSVMQDKIQQEQK